MKYILITMLLFALGADAQTDLPVVKIAENLTVHFLSPEPIQYVDISTKNIIGDLPLKNLLRIKLKDSVNGTDAVITIAGEDFITQYHIVTGSGQLPTEITIDPLSTHPLDISGVGFSQNQIKMMSLDLFSRKPGKRVAQAKAFGIKGQVNHLYTAGDYIFVDVSFFNSTKLKYDIDTVNFKIDDKKVNKASNVQSVELQPVYTLFEQPGFKKQYRNIFVFKKITFPGNKVLRLEINEKQISGRILTINISYQDILNADLINASF